jgi:hypothetical protein
MDVDRTRADPKASLVADETAPEEIKCVNVDACCRSKTQDHPGMAGD